MNDLFTEFSELDDLFAKLDQKRERTENEVLQWDKLINQIEEEVA